MYVLTVRVKFGFHWVPAFAPANPGPRREVWGRGAGWGLAGLRSVCPGSHRLQAGSRHCTPPSTQGRIDSGRAIIINKVASVRRLLAKVLSGDTWPQQPLVTK